MIIDTLQQLHDALRAEGFTTRQAGTLAHLPYLRLYVIACHSGGFNVTNRPNGEHTVSRHYETFAELIKGLKES